MKYCLTILFLLVFQFSFSQMKVEDIKDDSSAISFVNAIFDIRNSWKRANFCFDLYKQDSTIKQYYSQVKSPKWLKQDLNEDGKEDLIVCCCISFTERIVCFLSKENNYEIISASPSESSQLYFFKLFNNNSLIVSSLNSKNYFESDTILFTKENAFEFSSSKRKQIDSIRLKYSTELTFYSFDFMFRKDGHNSLEKQEGFSSTLSRYEKYFNSTETNNFFDIVEKLPYYKYKNEYWGAADDGFDWDTKIYFSDGSTMAISDHMGVGPYGIRMLYTYAFKFFDHKDWKKIN